MVKLRILLADDHDVVRRGLRSLVETQAGWEVCGEAATGHEAVEKAAKLKPNIVVMDISMPELNGLEATRQIRKAAPEAQVLILTIHESEQLLVEVLKARARGYMLKSDAGRDLVAALEALSQGKPFFSSKVAEILLSGYKELAGKSKELELPGSRLSAREREIIQLVAEGKSNKEVATLLNLSVKTVETHRANLMRKLNLHSLAELIHHAIQNKIVDYS
jgi:DNA-binding NarL/FixJ family response regulator